MPLNGNNLPIVFLLIFSMSSILQWNIRGFYSDYGDLLHILGDKEPVCMCIQESMLGDRVPCSPPGYSIETFSPTQQTPGNGLVTIIRQTAPYYRLNLNKPLQALAIGTQLHKQYTVCNINISPNEVIPPDSLAQLINQLPHPFR